MSDDFEKDLRDHLLREAQETRDFPRRVRQRIRDDIASRTRTGLVPQLALAGALVLVAVAALAFRNPHVIFNDVPSTIGSLFQQPRPIPSPQPFTCSDRSGGKAGASAQLSSIRTAPHDGYDRVVFEFTGPIPSYDLTRQDSATFVRDASGQTVPLDGGAGIKLVFRDADAASGMPADAKPSLNSVREIAQIGSYERVLSYGIGIAWSQCVRTLELSGPSRLVVDVATAASASTTAAPTPSPAAPTGTDLGPFTCLDHGGGSSGPAMELTAVRVAHQPGGYDRIVFEFSAPAGATAHLPAYSVSRQASAQFVEDPSGMPVSMRGSAGLRIVFHGASGVTSYSGPRDVIPSLPVIQEVEQLGDFEAVLSWGAGLSQATCIRTLELSNPTRLVIDIQTP